MARLLVTGGAGFIGSNFVHYWLDRHPADRLVVLDALTYAGNRTSLAPADVHRGFRFVHGDIRDRSLVEELLREEQIDTLVHFAAESHVDRSILGPDAFLAVNIDGTHALLKAALAVWKPDEGKATGRRFHHISTDEVYGSLSPTAPPFLETTPYSPKSPYAASKAAADHLVRAYAHTYRLPVSVSNCSNNYGPYHFPEKLIPLCIVNALEGRELPIYGDGRQVRDWLHVGDHCRGVEAILERSRLGATYNIGGDCERENLDVAREVCRQVDELFASRPELVARYPSCPATAGRPCESLITMVADRPGHDRRYAVDASLIAAELDWWPQISFEEGLRSTVHWYVEHSEWWRQVMDGSYRDWVEQQYGGREPSGFQV